MKYFIHILKYKLLIFIRLNTKFDFQSLLRNLGSSIIYIGFAVGAFLFSQKIIWFLITQVKVGLFLLHQFISIILFIFFISVNVGNIIVSYSTLYKSNEVSFLFTKPVEHVKIFVIKFLDNFFYSSSTLILILLSVLAGYAVYFNLSLSYLLLLLFFNFLPFMFTAGSLGVIILMLIIKLATKFGVRKVIYSIGTAYLGAVLVFFKINSPFQLVNVVMKYFPVIDKDQYLGKLIPPLIKFLPNNWLSESAFWLLHDNIEKALPLIFIQLSVSIILFSLAVMIGKKWYFNTWLQNIKLIEEYLHSRKKKISIFGFEKKSVLKSKTESLVKRDFFMFFRESSQVIHLTVLLFLILIFLSSVSGIHYIGLGNFYLQTGIFLSVFLFNLLFISTLSLRFIFPLISLEGESFWRLKSAPVDSGFLMKKKLLTFGMIIMAISLGLSYFSFYKFNFGIEFTALIITLFSAATIISINYGMGGLFANFKEKNAIRLSSSQGASIAFLINVIYMLFIVLVLFNPISNYFLSIMIRKPFNLMSPFYSVLPISIISIIIISFFLRAARKSLEKDF